MSLSLPDGFRLRRGDPDDLAAITALTIAEESAVRGSSQWTETDTREWFHALETSGELWVVDDEKPVGVLGLFFGGVARGWIGVDPACNGRGVGSALVRLAEERARERGEAKLKLGAFAENQAAVRLLEEAGYRDDRHYYQMVSELTGRPAEPEWPGGLTCTTFDMADARAFYDASNDAFADDHDVHALPFETWKRMRFEAPDFDPSLWFFARDGEEIAGIIRCEPKRWGCGWIALLGVRRPWRKRGLGRALLLHAFREFYNRGERRVGLGVDTQNPSGATRLYEQAGMKVVTEDISFERHLT